MRSLVNKLVPVLCVIAFIGILAASIAGHYMYPDLLIHGNPYTLNPML